MKINLKTTLWCYCLLILISGLTGCGLTKQAAEVSALSKCDFRLKSVEDIHLAGVSFQDVKSIRDIRFADVTRIMIGFAGPSFPLTMQVNVEARNPNPKEAGLNKLEWILYVDDILMTTGILEEPFAIPAGGTTVIPVQVALDLKKVLSGKSAESMMKFSLNLAGVGKEPTRFKIRLKPTILIAGFPMTYPGYINVNTSYDGK